MITATTMLYLYTETPLHAGTGSGLSSIDLPIQRERNTQYPLIQGSGIKGKLRATAEITLPPDMVTVIFGPSNMAGNASDHAGAIIAGDARILLFPVRSLNGVFAYVTSPDVLNRFKRDVERGQLSLNWTIPAPASGHALVTRNSEVRFDNSLVLEEYSFTADTDQTDDVDTIATWIVEHALPGASDGDYWSNKVKSSLVILPNDDFRDFALYATEVITRVRIDREKKTVEKGALWTEEHLPTDTLLYVPIHATNARKGGSTLQAEDILAQVKQLCTEQQSYLQLGGDETVGRGFVRVRWGN